MLNLSRKAEQMPASPIRKLVPFADEAKKKGIKVYHLNIGQPDIESPKEAIKAVKDIEMKLIEYPHSAGIPSYRNKLAEYYRRIGIDITPDEIIVTNGGSEAISMAISIICNPEDEIIVLEPFYTNYSAFALQNDARFRPISCKIENGFALPPIEEFEKAITPKTKAILICNPGNPTGTVYTRKELEQLGEIIRKHNLFLIADEVYREFCYTEEPHFSCMYLKGVENNVILVDSVSKRYSLCGVRIGALVSRNKELMSAALRYSQARLCSPALGQIASEGALDAPEEYFKSVKNEYIKRRDILLEALNKMEGVFSPMPMGAFYTMARLPIDDGDRFAQWLLQEFNYEGQTVMVAPAAGFYATPGMGKDEVRLAYVLKEEDLRAAMKCLEIALRQYPGRK